MLKNVQRQKEKKFESSVAFKIVLEKCSLRLYKDCGEFNAFGVLHISLS